MINRLPLLALILLWLPLAAPAQTWQFASLESELPDTTFTDTYKQRVFSVGTVVSDAGNLFGTYVLEDGSIYSYNIKFGTNPAYTLFNNPDFVHLAAGEAGCFLFVCINEMPFGVRVADTTATTGWLNTLPDSSPLPGSLPVYRFPGSFVEENSQDIVATSQRSAGEAFSAVLDDNLGIFIKLNDIPWVVALSSGQEPLVLGFRGAGGDCVVYGEACVPRDCEEDDGHQHTRGVGHREHGRGYGYGHDHDCTSLDGDGTGYGEPVLVKTRSDNSWQAWSFPETLAGRPDVRLQQRFPLTMNDTTVILRASVTLDGVAYPRRLFRCDLPQGIDTNGDEVVDCANGLEPLEPLATSSAVDTVIGFSLNNNGLLTGNYGFDAAGIGRPFFLDINAATPEAVALHNLASGTEGWELNNVTDINASGMAVGYGHYQCSEQPQSWTLHPDTTAAPELVMGHVIQPHNGAVAPGDDFSPLVPVSGGSGQYQYQLYSMRPGDANWQLEQDWSASPGTLTAPLDYLGDLCLRVAVRDAADATHTAGKVIRLRVTDAPLEAPTEPRVPDLLGDREPSDPLEEFTQLGGTGTVFLLLLGLAGFCRRHL